MGAAPALFKWMGVTITKKQEKKYICSFMLSPAVLLTDYVVAERAGPRFNLWARRIPAGIPHILLSAVAETTQEFQLCEAEGFRHAAAGLIPCPARKAVHPTLSLSWATISREASARSLVIFAVVSDTLQFIKTEEFLKPSAVAGVCSVPAGE